MTTSLIIRDSSFLDCSLEISRLFLQPFVMPRATGFIFSTESPALLSSTHMFCRSLSIGLLLVALASTAARSGAANPAGTGYDAAAAALKQFTLADGLQVTLFAAEPFVRNPANMDIDSRGRVWVTEGVNYRSSFQKWGTLDPAGDRIVILEDTDSDGVADKQTVFYQDPSINTALGICVLGNKVIVSDSPNVFILTDINGDGKADQRELLFTGIGGVDHDHGIHAFVFGPDGKLYFNMGNEGKRLRVPLHLDLPLHGPVPEVPTKAAIDLEGSEVNANGKPYRMGMVFRCNPDGSELETLAWNFRNNYEVAVDSFGTLWQSDNDDDGNRGVRINYVMDHGNFGYSDEMTGAGWPAGWQLAKAKGATEDLKVDYEWHQFDPGVVPDLLHTGAGSPTGIAVYEGKVLPEIFQNQVIHCDAGPRVVRAYPVQPQGAGFRAQATNLLATSDNWFRPSDVCVAPDGSLYVADWNDSGVGGHYMADQKLETMTGRIYRLAPPGYKPFLPKLNFDTAAGCVEALQSPNQATRYLAWTKLESLKGKAEKDLVRLWEGRDSRLRARALYLLAGIPGQEQRYANAALQDPNPDIRIVGLRLARNLKLDVISCVKALVRDPSPQVRRECALALRHNPSPDAPRLWAALAAQHNGQDRWYLEALGIGADRQWDRFLPAWLELTGDKLETPGARDIIWRSRGKQTPALLAQIINRPELTARDRQHFFRAFDFVAGPEKPAALVTLLKNAKPDTTSEILPRLKGVDLEANPDINLAILAMLDQTRDTPQFVEIVREFQIKGQEPALLALAARDPSSSAGVEAMRLALKAHHPDLINQALAGTNASGVVVALGNMNDKEVVPLLEPIVTDPKRDISVRKKAVRALAQSKDGATALLRLAEDQNLPGDLKLTAGSELNAVRWEDVKAKAARLLPPPAGQNAQPLPPIADLAKRTGNAANGAAVFRREAVACIRCHQVNGEGVDFGPNLSEIGAKLGKEALYESILDPSAGISFGFESWQIILKNGDDLLGLIVSETGDEIALKAVGGVVTRLKKSDITGRVQQKVSIMPAGVQQTMSQDELVDLVEYLSNLRKATR